MLSSCRPRLLEGRSRSALVASAVAAAFAALPAVAHADTVTQGESLTLSPSSAGRVQTDSAASGGKALNFWANASASRTVAVAETSAKLIVRARGQQCSGAPQMSVYVDGTRRLT